MANMAEYYHQISEIQKAVREREIHRLELEKQRLMKTHRREKRYEELRAKIKELHRELVHEELEATHRFQNLLAQVDAVKREHQLLAAHTERLRQKKRQYEMQMAKANVSFQYTVQDGQYQNFLSSVGAARRIIPQTASTQDPNLPQAQPVINPQSQIPLLNSSLSSSSNHWHVQPPRNLLPPEQMSLHKYEHQSLNVAGTPLPAQQGASSFITNPQTNEGTNSVVSLPLTSGATQFISPPVQFTHVKNLNPQANLVSASMGHTQSGESIHSISQVENAPLISNDSNSYNLMTHTQQNQAFHIPISEVQYSRDITPGTQEVNSQQTMFHPNYLATQRLHISHPPLQESQYIESLQKPINSIQNILRDTVSSHTHLPNKQSPPSSDATYGLSMTPASTVIYRTPESSKILDTIQSSSNIHQINLPPNESSKHMTPSVTKLPEATCSESLMKETKIAHPSITQNTSESAHNGTPVKDNREEVSLPPNKHFEQDQHFDADFIQVRATVKHSTPGATNSQASMQHDNSSCTHNDLDIRKNTEKGETDLDIMCQSGRVDKIWREVKEEKSSLENKDTETTVYVNSKIGSQGDYIDELATHEGHATGNESIPAINDVESHTQHVSLDNSSTATSSAITASPNKEISPNSNPISISKITSNNSIATSPQAKHVDTNLKVSMNHTLKGTRVDTLQSPGIHPEETNHPERKDETGKPPHQLVISQSGTSVANSPEKMNDQPSNISSGRNDSSKMCLAGSKTPKALQSKFPLQDQEEDNDSDFFDRDVAITGSAAYKSLVGDADASGGASLGTESDSDDAEGQISTIMSKQTQKTRSSFKPFASSIPSLRPPSPGTDTDSVDSVEAAIQAALKNKDHSSTDSRADIQQPQESQSPKTTPSKVNLSPPKENIKAGVRDVGSKPRPSAALQLNIESDSESYGVSAGEEASDEDDFDFYDKF